MTERVFEYLVREIESINGCERTKKRVLQILQRHRWVSIGVTPFKWRDRLELIEALKKSDTPRRQYARILSQRWGCSLTSAYRWLAIANQLECDAKPCDHH